MDKKLFEELTKSVKQAGAVARGERRPSRRREFSPSRILAVRERTELSQAQFARLLNVSVKTLQNWEQAVKTFVKVMPTDYKRVLSQTGDLSMGVPGPAAPELQGLPAAE